MENLYGYYFHYNPFTKNWLALERNSLQDYHAGKIPEKAILKNKDVNVLIKFLSKADTKFEDEQK